MTSRFSGNSSMPMAHEYGGPSGSAAQPFEEPAWKQYARKAHDLSEQVDNMLGVVARPVKPFLPAIGRFLIVVTFIEDAFRIMSQWGDQVHYVYNVRHVPYVLTLLFFGLNILCMFAGSALVILKRHLEIGVGALMFVVVSQAVVYGLILNFQFFFRNVSLIGGLLVVLSDAFAHDRRSLSVPGLPMIEDKDRSKYLTLAGRILLVFLFVAYMVAKKWTWLSGFFNIMGLGWCLCVVVGYKARLSALFLGLLLLCQNVITNPYWRYSTRNPTRDFLRYEHFQTLSIVGGLILLVNSGAGRISIDEKKKIY
uniref:ARAD1C18414p n=1 Tax=Blastobotrys adeninivorans TaxID=409370 RepID=A0A060T0U8_BLAAD